MSASATSTHAARGPLIVLAELGKRDFAWLDSLRRNHYPADRNRVPAHLTLFRSLPPSAEAEARRSLARAAARRRPSAEVNGAIDLDSGVAVRIESRELEAVRDQLVLEFRGLLSVQDQGPWTPHVTIQNKVRPQLARKLLQDMRARLDRQPIEITGLQLVRYDEGAWTPVAGWRFR